MTSFTVADTVSSLWRHVCWQCSFQRQHYRIAPTDTRHVCARTLADTEHLPMTNDQIAKTHRLHIFDRSASATAP